MMRYATAGNFRMALEERIRQLSGGDGSAIQRMRKRVAFERFLARLQAPPDSPWFLKGAFAMELWLGNRARTTRDLDLGIDLVLIDDTHPTRPEIAERLRAGAGHPLNDFFVFGIPVEGEEVLSTPDAVAYRFAVQVSLADRRFEEFRVDVGPMTPLVVPGEEIPESETLAFAGIAPGRFRAISRSQHFAEKVHAFTRRWEDRENTRVKDLVDLTLMLEDKGPDPESSRVALKEVFDKRGTHPLPQHIPDAPASWNASYTAAAHDLGLTHTTVEEAVRLLREFWPNVFP